MTVTNWHRNRGKSSYPTLASDEDSRCRMRGTCCLSNCPRNNNLNGKQ